jgi:hypothetical protein
MYFLPKTIPSLILPQPPLFLPRDPLPYSISFPLPKVSSTILINGHLTPLDILGRVNLDTILNNFNKVIKKNRVASPFLIFHARL